MENKQYLYSENRSFFKQIVRKTTVCGVFAVIESIAFIRTLTLPPDFWALTSLTMPLELVFHAGWLFVFGVGVVLAWRNSVTWAQVMVLLSVFAVYTALRLTLLIRADYDRQRLPFLLAGGCVLLLISLLMVVRDRRSRARMTAIALEVESEEDLNNGGKPQN